MACILRGARELFRVPKLLKMPKRQEHRNDTSRGERDSSSKPPPAEILRFPNAQDEESSIAIAKWLKLADEVLGADARKKA